MGKEVRVALRFLLEFRWELPQGGENLDLMLLKTRLSGCGLSATKTDGENAVMARWLPEGACGVM